MNPETFIEPIRRYLIDHHLDGRDDLQRTTPLMEWGVIDSFTIVDVLGFVDERFGITVPPWEITPANLRDLESLAALLARLEASAAKEA